MPTQYKYKAVTVSGERETGVINAPGVNQVEEFLSNRQLLPVRISPIKDRKGLSFFGFLRGTDYEKLITFTNSLSTMHRAGIPLLRALSIIRIGKRDSRFNQAIDQIRLQVQSGRQVSEAMSDHDDLFSRVYVASVAAGEESGKLENTLDELSDMLERDMDLNRQVKSAIRYPVTVVVVIVAAFFVLMNFVIPQFVEFYASFNAELPLATRVIIGTSDIVVRYWYVALAVLAGIGFGFKKLVSTAEGRLWYDRQLLKVPVLGNLIIESNIARFCLMFRILFNSGLPLVKSLSTISQTIKNTAIGVEITRLEQFFRRGQDTDILGGDFDYLPEDALHMISIGLESGTLEKMLKEIGNHYSKHVVYTSQHLTAIIEPILTLVLGMLVLILALAIFLPMWNLIQVFKG